MRKQIILTAIALSSVFAAKADPPKAVNISYLNGKLKIETIHPTIDEKKHHVGQIAITVDGKEVKILKLTSQSSAESDTEELEIPEIKKGSDVLVKCTCNKFGTKSARLKAL